MKPKKNIIYIIESKEWIIIFIRYGKLRLAEGRDKKDNFSVKKMIKRANDSIALAKYTGADKDPKKYEKIDWKSLPNRWEDYKEYPVVRMSKDEFDKKFPDEKL